MYRTDPDKNIFVAMGTIFHITRQYLDTQFRQYDLTRNEWLMLALLRNHGTVSQKTAKLYIGIEPSYFTKLLNTLEDKGLIIREIDPDDRRNRIIKPNPRAHKKLQKIFKVMYDFNELIQGDLTKKQLQELYQSLQCINDKLKQSIPAASQFGQ